jgi:hypothetical protein
VMKLWRRVCRRRKQTWSRSATSRSNEKGQKTCGWRIVRNSYEFDIREILVVGLHSKSCLLDSCLKREGRCSEPDQHYESVPNEHLQH